MVTKKHFEEIAKILGNNKANDALIFDFSNLFYKLNNRFDRVKFYEAILNH